MVGHQELRILQYNVQKSKDVVLAGFELRKRQQCLITDFEYWL